MKVGYLPEHHRFPRYLTGRQTLEFFAALSEVPGTKAKQRSAELLETVGMTAWGGARVSTYSKGMMQRIGVAQALVNDPELVILDEPTDGVDPVGRREIRDVLLKLKSEGRTVFVNSHLLSELEMICDRVAILVAGRVVQQGTIYELTADRHHFQVEVIPGDEGQVAGALQQALGRPVLAPKPQITEGPVLFVGKLSDTVDLELRGVTLRIETADAAIIQPVIDALRAAGISIRRIQPMRPSLEELFIEAVGGLAGGHNAGASISSPLPYARGGRP